MRTAPLLNHNSHPLATALSGVKTVLLLVQRLQDLVGNVDARACPQGFLQDHVIAFDMRHLLDDGVGLSAMALRSSLVRWLRSSRNSRWRRCNSLSSSKNSR